MRSKLPPLESLRFLEACVRHENMTRAARELGVTPAAVSLRSRDLEAELGTPLFIRAGPRITATERARILAGRIGEAVGELRQAVDACRAKPQRILITAVPTLAARWLTNALTDYHRQHPATEVIVNASDTLTPIGSFDISLRHGRGSWKGIMAHRIFGGEATAMLAPALATAIREPAQLADLPLIPDRRWRGWFAQFQIPMREARFTADYSSQELAARAALAGAGVALLSPVLFARLLAEGKLVRPFGNIVTEADSYFVAVGRDEQRSAVLEMRDFLIAHAHRLSESTGGLDSGAGFDHSRLVRHAPVNPTRSMPNGGDSRKAIDPTQA